MTNLASPGKPHKTFAEICAKNRVVELRPNSEPGPLIADAAELERFLFCLFRNCIGAVGWFALSSFEHALRLGRDGKPRRHSKRIWTPFGGSMIADAAAIASETANQTGDRRAVFSPPVALFGKALNKEGARVATVTNVVAAPVIAVEMDERPDECLARLTEVLGKPTMIVASGGVWKAPDGAEQGKRHAYWRLTAPAVTRDELLRLTEARRYACLLVGADETGIPVNHPMRWPGSWHTKGTPTPCRIVGGDEDRDIDLGEAIAALERAASAAGIEPDRRRSGAQGEQTNFKTKQAASAKTLCELVDLVPNDDDLSWNAWNRIGMAWRDASHASEEGRETFHRYSAKSSKYDYEETEDRWFHWELSPSSDLSLGTLIFEARKTDPTYRSTLDVEAWREEVQEAGASTGIPAAAAEPTVGTAADIIARLNARHALVMNAGKALVINENADRSVSFSDERSFRAQYANRIIVHEKKPASWVDIWWTHPARRQYLEGIDFDPNGVADGVYNTWRGLPISPAALAFSRPEDGCPLILQHMHDIICDGDETAYRYLLGWLAHIVQRPGEKPGVAVVVRGRKGTGKDTLGEYMRELLNPYYMHIASQDALLGDMNYHLANKLLLHLEEAIWAGSKQGENVLKSLITAPVMSFRPLYANRIMLKSQLRVFMSSNADWVVPATEDERRFLVLEASDRRRGDRTWFGALRAELNGAGPACLMAYLSAFPLDGFEVRDVPDTAALNRQKQASASPLDKWIRDELLGAEGTTWEDPDQPCPTLMKTLHDRYQHGARSRHEFSPVVLDPFSKHLKKVFRLGEPKQSRAHNFARVYTLPPRQEARAFFDMYSGTKNDWT